MLLISQLVCLKNKTKLVFIVFGKEELSNKSFRQLPYSTARNKIYTFHLLRGFCFSVPYNGKGLLR